MKSLQKIQFLEMHLLQMKHPRTKKWNHNPEYWVRFTICSFKWYNQWWKWNRNTYNEQQNTYPWGWFWRGPRYSLPAKKAATGSSAGGQSGTHVRKGRGGGDLPKISAFPANTPKSGGRGSSRGDKSPARAPRFSNNTGEGSASSAQGGRNRSAINRHPP